MDQLGQGLGFALEALEKVIRLLRREGLASDYLDSHFPFQVGVKSLVDGGHTPLTELLEDLIMTKEFPDQILHG
jgi:hypothetical protein